MKLLRNLRKFLTNVTKRLTTFDYVIFLVFITLFIFLFIFFRRENKFIVIRLKLTDPDVLDMSKRSLDEYAMAFRVGDKEYDELGQVVSEIEHVDAYRTEPQGEVVYLNIRAKALYNPRAKQYYIQGKPVVAGGPADILDFEQDDVLVAVDPQLLDELHVARFLPLDPELVARARPVGGPLGPDGEGEGLGVHEGEHQHLVRAVVGGDARDQPVGAKLRLEHRAELDFGSGGAGGKGRRRHGPTIPAKSRRGRKPERRPGGLSRGPRGRAGSRRCTGRCCGRR